MGSVLKTVVSFLCLLLFGWHRSEIIVAAFLKVKIFFILHLYKRLLNERENVQMPRLCF